MVTILIIIQTPKESVLLKQLFIRANIKVVTSMPSYSSYLKTMQYDPDIVILEIPQNPKSVLQFLKVVKTNKALKQKPFILYGPQFDEENQKPIFDAGASAYMSRPLDLKKLLEEIQKQIKQNYIQVKNAAVDKNQLTQDELQKLKDHSLGIAEKMELMSKHIGKLLAFPATVASILRVSQNDKSGANDLAVIIKSDPSVSTEILKVANSVYFARGGKRIIDIKDAIVRIGFLETKNIAMSLSVFKIMQHKNYETGFKHTEYWFHCLGVALIAERLAKNSSVVSADEAFVAGLLHDIGILLYNEFFNNIFLELLDQTTAEGLPFLFCQEKMLGFNHNQFIARLLAQWNFPEQFVNNVSDFCRPSILTKSNMTVKPLAVLVTMANIIAKSMQIGREADCCVEPIPNELFELVRFPYGLQKAFVEGIYTQLNMYNQILKIDKRTFPASNDLIANADKVNILCYSFTNEIFNPVVEYCKSQLYKVSVLNNLEEARQKNGFFHSILLTDANNAVLDQIRELQTLKISPFVSEPDKDHAAQLPQPTAACSKSIIFDRNKEFDIAERNQNSLITRYPVDLRNVDMLLACLLLNHDFDFSVNEYGALKKLRNVAINGKASDQKRIMIAHAKSGFRKKITDLLASDKRFSCEEANDGLKAVNMIKTQTGEMHLCIIDFAIPILSCLDAIKQIQKLPTQKRLQFLVVVSQVKKEELVPFIKIGVRYFIKESAPDDEIAQKLQEMNVY
ncbi:MAG: HDOD domain-containing protein [Chitinivibrionales bacterium]|nr:HDOD domain-containing protein [Chitinivibrionales bacterium]